MPAHLSPEQLAQALGLQRRCWTQDRIAAELGVHRTTVSRSLARHNALALKRLEGRTASLKAKHIDQLEWMAEEAARQWERSTEDARTISTTTDAGDPAGLPAEKVVETVKGQTGNPSLLREAREALADIRSILGLDPKLDLERAKFDHSTKPPEQPDDDFVIDLSDEEDQAQPGDEPPA